MTKKKEERNTVKCYTCQLTIKGGGCTINYRCLDGLIEKTRHFCLNCYKGRTKKEESPHLTPGGQFKSDKYPWCPPGFVPLKLSDPDARTVLTTYAQLHLHRDFEFSRDLLKAISIEETRSKKRGTTK